MVVVTESFSPALLFVSITSGGLLEENLYAAHLRLFYSV